MGEERQVANPKEKASDIVNTVAVRYKGKKVEIPLDAQSNRNHLKVSVAIMMNLLNQHIQKMLVKAEADNSEIDAKAIDVLANNLQRLGHLSITLYETPTNDPTQSTKNNDKIQVGGLIATVTKMGKEMSEADKKPLSEQPVNDAIQAEVLEHFEKIASEVDAVRVTPVIKFPKIG